MADEGLVAVPGADGIWEALYTPDDHDETYAFLLKGCKAKELKAKCEEALEKYKAGEIGPCVYLERMMVCEMPKGGGVLIYSAIPITDTLKAQVQEKGGCKVIIVPTSEHAKFHKGWMEAYPEAVVVCPGGDSMLPVIEELGDAANVMDYRYPAKWAKNAIKATSGLGVEIHESAGFQEIFLLHRKSKSLLTCDAFYLGCADKKDKAGWKNFPADVWKECYFEAYCEKSPCHLPIYRTFLSPEQKASIAKVIKKVLSWKAERVMSARSGKTSEGGAEAAKKIIEGHWGWCSS
mmetsp:Transcript_96658/g.207412  ORF Transcript_96658/g.207412 Transcript_96658/m.207412 type:complete len:292 (+) Transcript_96658:68-943(+)